MVMNRTIRRCLTIAFGLLSLSVLATAQQKKGLKETTMKATGTFEVKSTPVAAEDKVGDPLIGRLALDKQFSGALTGTSKGQMLGFQGETPGTGGYVAMEMVNGTLDGKKGSFALQHIGTMGDSKFDLNISVVPGSGTGELKGISGKMAVIIEGGKHSYVFEYTLPTAKPKSTKQ